MEEKVYYNIALTTEMEKKKSYHFDRVGLYEHGFGESAVCRLLHRDPFPCQGLNDAPVVEVVVVRVLVQVGQCHAVQFRIGQCTKDSRAEMVDIL